MNFSDSVPSAISFQRSAKTKKLTADRFMVRSQLHRRDDKKPGYAEEFRVQRYADKAPGFPSCGTPS
jgi:hypothetical protein